MCFSSILWLMVVGCLFVFLFSFDHFSVFVGGKILFCLLPFFHIFFHFSSSDIQYFSCSLSYFFLAFLHQVSAGPPIRKGTPPMLYSIYGRYGGAGRRRGRFIKFLSFPFGTRWGA